MPTGKVISRSPLPGYQEVKSPSGVSYIMPQNQAQQSQQAINLSATAPRTNNNTLILPNTQGAAQMQVQAQGGQMVSVNGQPVLQLSDSVASKLNAAQSNPLPQLTYNLADSYLYSPRQNSSQPNSVTYTPSEATLFNPKTINNTPIPEKDFLGLTKYTQPIFQATGANEVIKGLGYLNQGFETELSRYKASVNNNYYSPNDFIKGGLQLSALSIGAGRISPPDLSKLNKAGEVFLRYGYAKVPEFFQGGLVGFRDQPSKTVLAAGITFGIGLGTTALKAGALEFTSVSQLGSIEGLPIEGIQAARKLGFFATDAALGAATVAYGLDVGRRVVTSERPFYTAGEIGGTEILGGFGGAKAASSLSNAPFFKVNELDYRPQGRINYNEAIQKLSLPEQYSAAYKGDYIQQVDLTQVRPLLDGLSTNAKQAFIDFAAPRSDYVAGGSRVQDVYMLEGQRRDISEKDFDVFANNPKVFATESVAFFRARGIQATDPEFQGLYSPMASAEFNVEGVKFSVHTREFRNAFGFTGSVATSDEGLKMFGVREQGMRKLAGSFADTRANKDLPDVKRLLRSDLYTNILKELPYERVYSELGTRKKVSVMENFNMNQRESITRFNTFTDYENKFYPTDALRVQTVLMQRGEMDQFPEINKILKPDKKIYSSYDLQRVRAQQGYSFNDAFKVPKQKINQGYAPRYEDYYRGGYSAYKAPSYNPYKYQEAYYNPYKPSYYDPYKPNYQPPYEPPYRGNYNYNNYRNYSYDYKAPNYKYDYGYSNYPEPFKYPPSIPKLGFGAGFDEPRRGRKRGLKFKSNYLPSEAALLFNIKGKKSRFNEMTAFGLRPIA